MSDATAAYRAARDWLLDTTRSYEDTVAEFRFPEMPDPFNWVSDWFDVVAARQRRAAPGGGRGGRVEHGAHLRRARAPLPRGVGVAGADLGVRRGDSVIVMLGNRVELWESMLAIMRLGAVVMPTTTAVGPAELVDRIERGAAPARDRGRGGHRQVRRRAGRLHADQRRPDVASGGLARPSPTATTPTRPASATPAPRPDDRLLLYFTSGTTSRPKLVEHTQVSYPVGHLSTMYWLGVRPGDVHLNISSRRLGQARVVVLLRAVDRRGDDRRATTTRASTRRPCCTGCASRRSRRSARRRPSGGC